MRKLAIALPLLMSACIQEAVITTAVVEPRLGYYGAIKFGNLTVGDALSSVIYIDNKKGTSSIEGPSFDLPGVFQYQELSAPPCTLATVPAGYRCEYTLTFAPADAQQYSGSVSFRGSTLVIDGMGLSPGELTLSQYSKTIESVAGFDNQFLIELSNTGGSYIPYPEITFPSSNGYSIASTNCDTILGPGKKCNLVLSVKKTVAGAFNENATLTSSSSIKILNISGTVMPGPAYGIIYFSTVGVYAQASNTCQFDVKTTPVLDLYGNVVSEGTILTVGANTVNFSILGGFTVSTDSSGVATARVQTSLSNGPANFTVTGDSGGAAGKYYFIICSGGSCAGHTDQYIGNIIPAISNSGCSWTP